MSRELKPYPKYKDSGVEWIGEVPEEWETVKLVRLFRNIGSGGTPKSTNELYYESGTISWINTGDLNDGYLTETKNKVTKLAVRETNTLKLYPANALVVAMYGATIGKISISRIEAVTNQACCVLADPINVDMKFIYYWFLTNREDIINSASGGGQPNISQNLIRALKVFKPVNMDEQIAIVNFLDQKTSEIDALIADKEKLITLLEEKRQAVITETVTKGLDPNVKMKDSGIEWIGEIPQHWDITKIKYTSYVKGRIGWQGLRSDEFKEEGGYYLVTGTDFNNGYIEWNGCNRIDEKRFLEAPEIHLKNNDVLITKDGTIGKVAIVDNKPEFATLNSGVFVTRPLQNNKYYNKYMYWLLNSDVFKDFVDMKTGGTTIKHLYQDTLVNYQYPLPPFDEQKAISEEIDKYTAEANELIDFMNKQISKLKEYRESLIYEAVTGKVDLRNYGEESELLVAERGEPYGN